jgi:hypothetical protein
VSDGAPLQARTPFSAVPRKEYDIRAPRPKAFMVEVAQWDRIQLRVDDLEKQRGIGWLLPVATTIFGISASAGLALLALPRTTTEEGELAAGVEPTLWAVTIGGAVLTLALVVAWYFLRMDREDRVSDICNEMDTIREAWEERGES